MTETIALFGGTGNTGKCFLKLALDGGFQVQAMVRSKAKVDESLQKNDKLKLTEGDFSNKEAIKETMKDATYIVSMGQGPMGKPSEYPPDLMLNFFKTIVEIVKEDNPCPKLKVLLYQAGAFSALPDKPLPMVGSFFKKVVGEWIMRIGPNIEDNTKVIQYIYDNSGTIGFNTIVSRPAALADKPSNATLRADHFSSSNFSITFYDLAVWSLKAIQDQSLYGTYPFVVPVDKNHTENIQPKIDSVANPVVQPVEKGTKAVTQPVTEKMDKAMDPVTKAAGSAVAAVRNVTKPVTDKIDTVMR